MKRTLSICAALLFVFAACRPTAPHAPTVEGHYVYEHSFDYELEGNSFDVHETGTMDFYADGTALDSARQVYVATLQNGDTLTWAYNYISPSRWRLEGEDFFFAGINDRFCMELMEGEATDLTQKIVDTYSAGIDYEYKFHLDSLTDDLLQWSFTYRDGHSDTWRFYREKTSSR